MNSIKKTAEGIPVDPFILDSLGWINYRLGNFALAVDSLRKALDICQDAEIAAHLREVLAAKSRIEEANVVGTLP